MLVLLSCKCINIFEIEINAMMMVIFILKQTIELAGYVTQLAIEHIFNALHYQNKMF